MPGEAASLPAAVNTPRLWYVHVFYVHRCFFAFRVIIAWARTVRKTRGSLGDNPNPGRETLHSYFQKRKRHIFMNPSQPMATPAQAQVFCPNCRGGNPQGAAACIWCGKALDGPPVPNRAASPDLFSAYKAAVLKPSAEGLASEVPGASWGRVWLGLGLVLLASLLSGTVSILFSLAAQKVGLGGLSTGIGTLFTLPSLFGNKGSLSIDVPTAIAATGGLAAGSIVMFFLSTLYLYWLCGRFGGQGRTGRFGEDYKVHAYLLTLISVPTSLASSLFALVPYVGSAAGMAVGLYAIFLQYLAARASMQLPRSQAQLAMIVYVLTTVVIGGIIAFFVMLFVLNAMFTNLLSTLGSSLR